MTDRTEVVKNIAEMIAAGVADDLSSDEIAGNVMVIIETDELLRNSRPVVGVAQGARSGSDTEHFTLVFRGDIGKLPKNPFHIETPFGFAVASARGHALDELDALASDDRTTEGVRSESDRLLLAQARYVLKNLNVERPGCGYDKLADACDRAALQPSELTEGRRGAADITAERQRQVTAEGWSPDHDDEHADHQIPLAALCYLYASIYDPGSFVFRYWPWDQAWWKPADARRNLVKAGALIAAEIDRLDRASQPSSTQSLRQEG